MKKTLLGILMALVAMGLTSCESYDVKPLHFINASTYMVVVTSLSTEWVGFALAPGQDKKLTDIRDVDYTYTPADLVQEGFASTDRYIVFVNNPPANSIP